jgi:hypothetical protein
MHEKMNLMYLCVSVYVQLIRIASQMNVELSSEAERVVQGYYMASRRLVAVGCSNDIVTASAVSTL